MVDEQDHGSICPIERDWFLRCLPFHLRTKLNHDDQHLLLDELTEKVGHLLGCLGTCFHVADRKRLQAALTKMIWKVQGTMPLPLQLLPRLKVSRLMNGDLTSGYVLHHHRAQTSVVKVERTI